MRRKGIKIALICLMVAAAAFMLAGCTQKFSVAGISGKIDRDFKEADYKKAYPEEDVSNTLRDFRKGTTRFTLQANHKDDFPSGFDRLIESIYEWSYEECEGVFEQQTIEIGGKEQYYWTYPKKVKNKEYQVQKVLIVTDSVLYELEYTNKGGQIDKKGFYKILDTLEIDPVAEKD